MNNHICKKNDNNVVNLQLSFSQNIWILIAFISIWKYEEIHFVNKGFNTFKIIQYYGQQRTAWHWISYKFLIFHKLFSKREITFWQ